MLALKMQRDHLGIFDPADPSGPITCTVEERDADCEVTPRMVVPEFETQDGPHGPER